MLLFENIKLHLADSISDFVNEKSMTKNPSPMAINKIPVFDQVTDDSLQSATEANKDEATSMDEVPSSTVATNFVREKNRSKKANNKIKVSEKQVAGDSQRSEKKQSNSNAADKKLVSPKKSINLIEMKDDYWLEDRGWMCQSCEKVFKLEIAFKNHLRRTEMCNLSYMCGNCNADFKLEELKLHILKKPQCIGQTAILQSYYAKALSER